MAKLDRPRHWSRWTGLVETAIAAVVLLVVLWLFITNVNKPRLPNEQDRR